MRRRVNPRWAARPQGDLVLFYNEYAPVELSATEHGAAYSIGPGEETRNRDSRQVGYFREPLLACGEAIRAGVRARGYFTWSRMDRFEWTHGYVDRFGRSGFGSEMRPSRSLRRACLQRTVKSANGAINRMSAA